MGYVKVKFFGPLREIVGKDELQLDHGLAADGETAFNFLAATFPSLRNWKKSVRLAINLDYAEMNSVLKDGDEVSFIPPVSGG